MGAIQQQRGIVLIYQLGLDEAIGIVQRERPLSETELRNMTPVETHAADAYFQSVRPRELRPFDRSALTGEERGRLPLMPNLEIFPPTLEATPNCFCLSYYFAIEQHIDESGNIVPRLVLRCEYFCYDPF
jgi:hypothetical protein